MIAPRVATPVSLLSWGGTITMDPDTLEPGSPDQMIDLVRTLTTRRVTHVIGANTDSADATRESMWRLVTAVEPLATIGPVLITHGTDTLSYAAATLAVGLTPDYPVVLTGATTPLGTHHSDATTNLRASLDALELLPPGVWVVFTTAKGALVIQGGYVDKRTDHLGGFDDVAGSPYGYITGDKLVVLGDTRATLPLPPPVAGPIRVEHVWPGWQPLPPHGQDRDTTVVFVLYPTMAAPSAVIAEVTSLHTRGQRVVLATHAGTETHDYPSTRLLEARGAERSILPLELTLAALCRPTAEESAGEVGC